MSSKKIYSVCANSFKKWRLTNKQYNNIYNILGRPKPFDITFKNILETHQLNNNNFYYKQLDLYHKICLQHRPANIEICPALTYNLLPLFTNTLLLHDYIEEHQNNLQVELLEINGILNKKLNNFILIHNKEYLNKIYNFLNNKELNFISFEISISESFHFQNTLKPIANTEQELYEMMYMLDENKFSRYPPFVKLYVSCINECPINGKMDNNFIINRLLQLNKTKVDNICLIDTCGTLNVTDFEYIVDNCNKNGLPFKRLSLQLRVKPRIKKEKEIEKIVHSALERKIINFDVSMSGINTNITTPILSYEQYYKFLVNYIKKYKK